MRVPSSKSATNRALLLASLSAEPVVIGRPLVSEDSLVMQRCLSLLGAKFRAAGETQKDLLAHGPLSVAGGGEVHLDTGDSGTAARFLTALATTVPGKFLLTGSERLRERPIAELVAALRSRGARIAYSGREGCLPVSIEGGSLTPGRVVVDASRSSQFYSALLLAGAALEGGLEVGASGSIASRPYVAVTLSSLRAFGHEVSGDGPYRVSRERRTPERYEVPGDFSSALPLLAAAGICGGDVAVRGLTWPSGDADALALSVFEEMGIQISGGTAGVSARCERASLRSVTVAATDFPDAVPTLAALAAFAHGTSRFDGVGHLRLKESDRIDALALLLSAAGADAFGQETSLVVTGPVSPSRGGARLLPTFSDHRIAMAAALLSLALPGLLLENPDCVAKSYPDFFRDLESLVVR